MSLILPFSEACERNKEPIYETIEPFLKRANKVLEIGTGTAQHAVHFAKLSPHLNWQPSDQAHYLDGIKAQLQVAQIPNISAPVELDVTSTPWFSSNPEYDLIYTANTFHIMSWPVVQATFAGLSKVSHAQTTLIAYGPFKFDGEFTSLSNQSFDQSLRQRGEGSGIRDFEAVCELATNAGFRLLHNFTMPANNQCLVWQQEKSLT